MTHATYALGALRILFAIYAAPAGILQRRSDRDLPHPLGLFAFLISFNYLKAPFGNFLLWEDSVCSSFVVIYGFGPALRHIFE